MPRFARLASRLASHLASHVVGAAAVRVAIVRAAIVLGAASALTGGSAGAQQAPGAAPPGFRLVAPLDPRTPPATRPSINLYGVPGLVDMPTAEVQPDTEFWLSAGGFGAVQRLSLNYQLTPRLSATFRYMIFEDLRPGILITNYDRAFDVRYLLLRERRHLPSVLLGLQDFAGTGIQSAEYLVASKTLSPRLRVTAGLGWGRLAGRGTLGAPLGPRNDDRANPGGQFEPGRWFTGEVAPFGGLEWRATDRLTLKAEYSSDVYEREAGRSGTFVLRSPVNLGAEYQWGPRTRLGLYALHGSELGFQVTMALNPRRGGAPLTFPAPPPLDRRPPRAAAPDLWTTDWRADPAATDQVRTRLVAALAAEGLDAMALDLAPGGQVARLRFETGRFRSRANAVGRAARAMAAVLPPSVEVFEITPTDGGLAQATVTLRRTDLERFEARPDQAEALRAAAVLSAPRPLAPGSRVEKALPRFRFSLGPAVTTSLFDPNDPLRYALLIRARGRAQLAPGLTLSGIVDKRLTGTIQDARISNSNLPAVRTSFPFYSRTDAPVVTELTLGYARHLGGDVYGRVTAGYLERMFGGVSAELLWKPVDSRLALGVEVNRARQRAFDGRFGFQPYEVTTGHVSAYYDFGGGYLGQLDVGRYLAGDDGATIALDRTFANGWSVGAFATFTNVSARDFGEGSFDKGVRFTIPVSWITGQPTQARLHRTVRPIQRDGGARLRVSDRLYDRIDPAHGRILDAEWGRIWR
ncbi:MAG: YjbH domain-containing protein [Shimia sp.]